MFLLMEYWVLALPDSTYKVRSLPKSRIYFFMTFYESHKSSLYSTLLLPSTVSYFYIFHNGILPIISSSFDCLDRTKPNRAQRARTPRDTLGESLFNVTVIRAPVFIKLWKNYIVAATHHTSADLALNWSYFLVILEDMIVNAIGKQLRA